MKRLAMTKRVLKTNENGEIDMKEIIRKALMMRLGKPKDSVYITHLSPLRGVKRRASNK
jgi:hypothetical protein